ncbi:phosphodiester glycosidase family protein [Streptomyces tanashiensis]|uniref:phosphodiester glycosidase family protein n=1 Tax=Streptomyces tanashiensis TaxID=67367 RepID=UPI0036E63136
MHENGADRLRVRSEPTTTVSGRETSRPAADAAAVLAGGTPSLVRKDENGTPVIYLNPAANGMVKPLPDAGGRYTGNHTPNNTLTGRHARTLVGRTKTGGMLLVVIDGRGPENSVGVTLPEAAAIMKWLGAEEAVGMGSGGDSALILPDPVTGEPMLANKPRDTWGGYDMYQRQISNAIALVPSPPLFPTPYQP